MREFKGQDPNYPPGVSANDPHFDPPECEYDMSEMKSILTRLDDALGVIDEAADWAVNNDIIGGGDYDSVIEITNEIYDEIHSVYSRLESEGWY